MSWALHLVEKLKLGESVTFNPRGNSMSPLIKSGEEVTVSPVINSNIKVRDIVLLSP